MAAALVLAVEEQVVGALLDPAARHGRKVMGEPGEAHWLVARVERGIVWRFDRIGAVRAMELWVCGVRVRFLFLHRE